MALLFESNRKLEFLPASLANHPFQLKTLILTISNLWSAGRPVFRKQLPWKSGFPGGASLFGLSMKGSHSVTVSVTGNTVKL